MEYEELEKLVLNANTELAFAKERIRILEMEVADLSRDKEKRDKEVAELRRQMGVIVAWAREPLSFIISTVPKL